MIRRLMDRPSVIAAVAVGPSDSVPASITGVAPILMSVKFVNNRTLSRIAAQLHLTNLRKLDQESPPVGDLAFDVNDPGGNVIGRFAWTPKRPGAKRCAIHRGRVHRLRAACRLRASLHASDGGGHCGRRIALAPSRHA
ncbi:MAG: hypothetical protein WCC80_15685 [Pseudolabrys sp.]